MRGSAWQAGGQGEQRGGGNKDHKAQQNKMAHTVARTAELVRIMAKKRMDWATPEKRNSVICRLSFLARTMPRIVPGIPRQGDHQGDKLCVHCEVGMQGNRYSMTVYKYIVTINPAAVQLLPDTMTAGGLTLTDTIPDNLTLVINKSFPMTLKNIKDQNDKPALNYSYDSSTRQLVVHVPDGKALELVFYAQLSGKTGNIDVSNTVNLSGGTSYSVSSTDNKKYQIVQSSAGLNGDDQHIRLKKTREDASTALAGAKFDIVKVNISDDGAVTTETIGNNLEVDANGSLVYPRENSNDPALLADTLLLLPGSGGAAGISKRFYKILFLESGKC